jgi:protein translocase SecG subunit
MTSTTLNLAQVVVSILLVVTILLQQRGAGLSSAFGGSGGAYHTRRGFEKTLFRASIVFAVLFLLLAVSNLIVV